MNDISHKQAIQYIERRMDGMLSESQMKALDQHLQGCDSCRLYAADMDGLSARLQNEFRRRWDDGSGPSQDVMENVTAKARRIRMTNRISSGAKLLAGAVALIALAVAINFMISQLQNTSPATSATEAVGSPPLPADRLLAFTSDQNGNSEIYVMHADGSGMTNLTNNPAQDSNPVWSPDGKRIAFESDRDGSRQIYLMNADGSDLIQLTHDGTDHFLPMNIHGESNPWTSDGKRLLLLQQESEPAARRLYSLDIKSGNAVRLADGRVQFNNLSWSPDGKSVAYVLNDSPTPDATFVAGLYIMDSTGNNRIAINEFLPQTDSVDKPSYYWSASGDSVIFIAYRHIDEGRDQWIAYEFFPGSNQLAERATSSGIMDDWWEGTSLIHGTDLYTLTWLRSDGTFNTFKPLAVCDLGIEASYGFLARRSPNGSQVLSVSCPNKEMWFYYASPDGRIIKPLTSSPMAAFTVDNSVTSMTWSSDDRFIAVTLVSPEKSSLYILNVSEPSDQPWEMVMSSGELYAVPSWQPVP